MILRAMLAVAHAKSRAFHARQDKGDDPDKKKYPGPPGWVFGVGLTIPHSKKLIVTKVEQRNKLDRFNDDGRKRTRYERVGYSREKWKGIVDRPKPTAGCSANGRKRSFT
jgi:hypothetical protein